MTKQPTLETTLSRTLYVLVRQIGLTVQEVALLRLSNIHLAGKNPNITFTPKGSEESKTITLDLETHRALVNWLVRRPNSIGDFLFPGNKDNPMEQQEVEQFIAKTESEKSSADKNSTPRAGDTTLINDLQPFPPRAGSETIISGSRPKPDLKPFPPQVKKTEQNLKPAHLHPVVPNTDKTAPPRFIPLHSPEINSPPPPLNATINTAFNAPPPLPTTMPEIDKEVDISLPTATPTTPEPISNDTDQKDKPPVPQSEVKTARRQTEEKQIKADNEQQKKGIPTYLLVIGIIAIILVATCGLFGGAIWFGLQTETGRQLVASMGLEDVIPAPATTQATTEPTTEIIESPESPLETPTLPSTSTATALSPTNTATPPPTKKTSPTNTTLPTKKPTSTTAPTATKKPVPAARPTKIPTPKNTPTPSMKYKAPVLLEPQNSFEFIHGNTITLRWKAVGKLAPDEQYAVRLVYTFRNELAFQGTNLKEAEWSVPISLYGQIDPPINRYEWFVVVERLNADGSGTNISPESERRTFTWR